MHIEIKNRFTGSIILAGEYESIKDALERNRGANLGGADLRGANLGGANLGGADLRGADLREVKGYLNSHDFFTEIVRRQSTDTFTEAEWATIGQIIVHTLCWDSINKRHKETFTSIAKKLADVGFLEWAEKMEEVE